jgi:DNA-binding MurR/RpiR family transcriptional regulator
MLKIEKTIKRDWRSYTPSEQKLAAYFLSHLHELAYETAASIGERVSVSPMTVGRYIRKLGYADLRDIKDELRAGSGAAASNTTFASAPLNAKVKGLADVYKLPQSSEWPRIVSRIATASVVHVASFHVGRFMGMGFAATLQSLRPRVHFSDGADGSYADVLLDPEPGACLVLIDFRRYSRHFRLLAEEAAARNVRTVILTDVYCHWARALSDDVLMIETEFGIRSLSMAQVLFELLLAAVANERKGAGTRVEAVHELRQKFIGGPDDAKRRGKNRG